MKLHQASFQSILVLLVLFFNSSCKKENGDKLYGPAIADTTRIEIIRGKDGDMIAYDSQFRVIERASINLTQQGSKRYSYPTFYKYLPDMLIKTNYSFNGIDSITNLDTVLLTGGVFKGDSNEVIQYSSDGYLIQANIKIESTELILKGVYQGGNLIKEDISPSEISEKEIRTYTYDQQRIDPYRLISQTGYPEFLISAQAFAPVTGKANKNLLKSMDSNGWKYFFTYEYDSQNRIIKIMVHEGFVGTHPYRTYDINYVE